jgi:hypothetical protein
MNVLRVAIVQMVHHLKADAVRANGANPDVRQCRILWWQRWIQMEIVKSLRKNFRRRRHLC